MANYEYAEGTVISYAIIPPGTFAVTVRVPYKGGTIKQKYEFEYASFVRLDVREGTRVSLRMNMDLPYLLRQWQFVKFIL